MDIGQIASSPLLKSVQAATKEVDAAHQFESLLIAQMLKAMHEEGAGWMGTGDDKSADSAISFAEEQFASAISAGGGLGIAKMIQTGLESKAESRPVSGISQREGVSGNGG